MGATTATLNRPFAQASPAELRETIVPEDRELFDEQYRQALDAAAETLTLDALEKFLAHWRRIAWSQTDMGHEKWRAMLARAEETLRTGESPPGAVSADVMRQRLRARLARA
jgi:predicted anti-sigma-YlaC factor YlaD